MEEAQLEKAGWDGGMTSWVYPGCRPFTRIHGGRIGVVDSAREENKARGVVEVYIEPGGDTYSRFASF